MDSSRSGPPHLTPEPEPARLFTALLVRHAQTDAVGHYLAGRRPGVRLNAEGRSQLSGLCARLEGVVLDAIYSSPLERASETAAAIARGRGLAVYERDDLQEVDFGEWTGRTFAELSASPAWQTYNRARATAEIPAGESPRALTTRICGALEQIRQLHPGGTVAIVSHAEPIRALVLFHRGLSLDVFHATDIAPASITTLRIAPDGTVEVSVNAGAAAVLTQYDAKRSA